MTDKHEELESKIRQARTLALDIYLQLLFDPVSKTKSSEMRMRRAASRSLEGADTLLLSIIRVNQKKTAPTLTERTASD